MSSNESEWVTLRSEWFCSWPIKMVWPVTRNSGTILKEMGDTYIYMIHLTWIILGGTWKGKHLFLLLLSSRRITSIFKIFFYYFPTYIIYRERSWSPFFGEQLVLHTYTVAIAFHINFTKICGERITRIHVLLVRNATVAVYLCHINSYTFHDVIITLYSFLSNHAFMPKGAFGPFGLMCKHRFRLVWFLRKYGWIYF